MAEDPKLWRVAHVTRFLERLELDSVVPAFTQNGVNGEDLLNLSDADLKAELGLSTLQIRKIRHNLPTTGTKTRVAEEAPKYPAQQYGQTATGVQAPEPSQSFVPAAVAGYSQQSERPAHQAKVAEGMEAKRRLEAEVAAFPGQISQAQGSLAAYSKGTFLLKQASEMLKGSLAQLQKATALGKVDMIGSVGPGRGGIGIGGPRGVGRSFGGGIGHRHPVANMGVDVAQRHAFDEAKRLVESSVPPLTRAKQLLPSLPAVDVREVQKLGLGFADIAFNSFLVDMAVQSKIRKTQESIASTERQVEEAHRWASQWAAKIRSDLDRLQGEYSAKSSELNVYRKIVSEA